MKNDPHVDSGIRLQKVISQAGVASRRHAEILITSGRVRVDDKVVRKLGTRVDPSRQVIHVDGERLLLDTESLTIALNKPVGVVSTMDDPEGRACLADYTQDYNQRLFHVGRLDTDTAGLILLTNDGELAHRLMHPSFEIPKTYVATVPGEVPRGLRKKMLRGIELEDGPVQVQDFRTKDQYGDLTLVELTLHEGRNRIVRRLLESVGFPVVELVRTQFGPVKIGRLHPGVTRKVDGAVLQELYKAVNL
ncbi:pseudouridine synthase [Gleimia europaea]|uniref:pseudouridine synthase n=1 Tax=Gleimia europaea TaxID=66228 RepID=UPI00265898FA|nr:pseudouridine synthase [Gleimia europaea]MDK7143841.1 pseudouridine synthase [Gleimia europaea]MDP9834512.1 23S rRNA pseudouridine2605 synthase [Gleimia europaea]